MNKLCGMKKVTSWLLLVVMLITTILPGNLVVKAAEVQESTIRSLSDRVEASVGGQPVRMELYANGVYEAKVNTVSGSAITVSGSAITVSVNGITKGSTSCTTSTGDSYYVRYNSYTGEVTNSITSPAVFKQSATWVGNFTGLGVGINNWAPDDMSGDLEYIGGGIFAKTFTFTPLQTDVTLGDAGYKVVYNHAWGNGEVTDDNKVNLTVPAGTSSITVFADSNTGYITDSINTPSMSKVVSLIGTVREDSNTNWEPTATGWEMKRISKDYYAFSKVVAEAGSYEYKCSFNHANEWPDWGNHTVVTTAPNTNVVFLYNASTDTMYDSVNNYNTIATTFGFPLSGETDVLPDAFAAQPGGNAVWRVTGSLGNYDNWNPNNSNTVMSHLVGEYYVKSFVLDAGSYQFKFTKNGAWSGAIGSDGINDNAANFNLTLTKKTKISFYLNDELTGLDKVRTNISDLEAQGIKQYTQAIVDSGWPRLVGSLQTKLGEASNWSPADASQMFVDYYFNNSMYKLQRTLPTGNYECKAVFGDNWGAANYGIADGNNLALNVLDASGDVTFSIDNSAATKVLSHNYKPNDSNYDGLIDTSALYFDSRSTTYKKPFGAIKQGSEDVTFRFAAKTQDAQLVKLELIDNNGVSNTYDMSVTTVLDGKDYWEVTVPKKDFTEIGIWGYKFIVIDGTTKCEYGDDSASGGTGVFSADGQMPYNLTVYANDYSTPVWMKNAVVYQIFPDRFYDGDPTNNEAKTVDGCRGDKVQLFNGALWSTLPENPRQSEEANKPYYPNATTDGVWTNEFYGGDIEGIQEKLSYLKTLGVSAIYLNPVSWAASNHKYDASDYKHLDPMFGEPVYNTLGDPTTGLNYEATKKASDKVYENFAKVCNDLGINLISDGVFNHVGDDSIYFDRYEKYPEIGAYEYWSRVWDIVNDENMSQAQAESAVKEYFKAQMNPATKTNYTDEDFCYINWFKIENKAVYKETTGAFDHYYYEGWWGYDSLPVVATVEEPTTNLTNDSNATIAGEHEYNNVKYRENVIGYDLNKMDSTTAGTELKEVNSQRWLWMGSSGWRLDVAPDVSDETWKQFRTAVKSAEGRTDVNGNAIDEPVILGEEWGVATKYLLGDMFDSVMNYQFRAAIQNFIVNDGDASDLNTTLEIVRENYPKEAWQAMLNLVDSHDTVRNITKIDNPTWEEENTKNAPDASEKAIKLQALTAIFQMSYPGAPTIYYGDEVGVTGTKDPDSRRTFPWERVVKNADGSYSVSTAYDATYGDLFDAYVKATDARNKHLDLFATGDIKTAYAEGKTIAYARKSDTEGGLSIINKSDKVENIVADVKDFLPDGLELKDQLGSDITATVQNGTISISIPAYTGMMMVSTTQLTALPTSPANLTAVAAEGVTGEVNLSWDAVQEASGYNVYRTLLEGMETVKLNDQPITDITFIDTNVTNGTRYYYYVKSIVNNSLSVNSNVATALPSYKITDITTPTSVSEMTIGVGKKTENTEVTITIPGLTDNASYTDKEVPGLYFTLAYYKDGASAQTASEVKLRYRADSGQGKVYQASFEPTEVGVFHYFTKATINNGNTYTTSAEASMTTSAANTIAIPEAPILEQPLQESNRVTLKWSVSSKDNSSGYEIYRIKTNITGPDIEYKIATLDSAATTFTDFLVSNDNTYIYRVAAFNDEYRRASSQIVSITPKLTMVDVTIRLTIPDKVFTSATDNIYIAGDVNGWNASGWLLKKPSGATDSNIVEYTFKMMAGKKIQYKYTRGSWATEALTSNTANDTTSPGNYAYSSTDTNINLTIANQGGNKMMVNDYVLRWVDMPIMVTVPRISYKGEIIEYTTSENSFNLQASVPYGELFTINGKDINSISEGAMDAYGNVRLDNLPLSTGLNEFVLHIEPTDETKAKSWLTDTGRIASQMTATTKICITKTTETTDTPTVTPIPTDTPTVTPIPTDTPTVTPIPTNTPTVTPIPTDTPTVTPIPTNTPTVTPIPTDIPVDSTNTDGEEPQVSGKNGVTGWSGVQNELEDIISNLKEETGNKPVLAIEMNKATMIPKNIMETIKGKNIDLTLDYGDYTWTISGKSIKGSIQKDFDLSISEIQTSEENSSVSKALTKALKESQQSSATIEIRQFEIAYDGAFPFTAELTLKVGTKYRKCYVFLNYYNETTKKLEQAGYGKVDKDGNVTVTLKHASSYVLTSKNPILPSVISSKTLHSSKTYELKIKNLLDGATVTYSSNNKSVAVISKSGKIKAIKAGTAVITAKVKQAGKTYSYRTKITVKK